MKGVLEMEGDDENETMWVHLMPLNWHIQTVKVVNFMLCVLLQLTIIKP